MDSKAEQRERRQKAYALRMAGASFQQIADQLGYKGRQGAYNAVATEVRRHEAAVADVADVPTELIMVELQRLDQMQIGLWPAARRGDVQAVDRVLKISERRSLLQAARQRAEEAKRSATREPDPHGGGLDDIRRKFEERRRAAGAYD